VVEDAVRKTLAAGKTVMADPEAKVVLAAYGSPTVPIRIAGSPAQSAQLAESIGFPVAVKLLSPDITNPLGRGRRGP